MRRPAKAVLVALVCVSVVCMTADSLRVFLQKEKPIFSFPGAMEDDGGSGVYFGLGYSIEIRGSFMPDASGPRGVQGGTLRLLWLLPVVHVEQKGQEDG